MASDTNTQLDRQQLLDRPQESAHTALGPPFAPAPLATESMHIVHTAAAVDIGGVAATFTLDAKPRPTWQGAFVRAFEGTLGDAAGRWRFDGSGIVVTRVRQGKAADVAAAVRTAVDAANSFLAGRAEDADAATAAAAEADAGLQREAVEAAAAMREALGV